MVIGKILEDIRDHLYQVNHTWIASVRRHLRRNMIDGLTDELAKSKPLSFLSFPIPECSCMGSSQPSSQIPVNASSTLSHPPLHDMFATMAKCPSSMDNNSILRARNQGSEEDGDDVYEDEPDSEDAALLFREGGESNEGGGETSNKEEAQMDDQEDVEGGDR